jgi:hypothetical protein
LTDNFADLMQLAAAVVEVKIVKLEPLPDNGFGVPMTLATLAVKKVYKGAIQEETISAEFIGGSHDNQHVIAAGQPQFSVGDRAVLLLTKAAKHAVHWRIVGGDAGHVILVDQLGQAITRRATGTFDFFVPDAQSLTGYREVKAPAVTLDRFNELMQALILTGRPVLEAATAQAFTPPKANTPVSIAAVPIELSRETSLAERAAMILIVTTAGWLLLRGRMRRFAK